MPPAADSITHDTWLTDLSLPGYPRRYEDRTTFDRFPTQDPGRALSLRGEVTDTQVRFMCSRKRFIEAKIEDPDCEGAPGFNSKAWRPPSMRLRRLFNFLIVPSVFFFLSASAGKAAGQKADLEVVEISSLPDPKTTPYVDCLVGVKCRINSQADSGKEAIVLFDLFRNRVLFPAAKLRPGQRVSVTLIPMETAEKVRRIMQANDFLEPDFEVFYVSEWERQAVFERKLANRKSASASAVEMTSSNADVIRRTLIAHEGEVTGGMIGEFFFWSHQPEVYLTDFWKDQQPTREGALGCRDSVLRFHESLKSRGIRLIFVPVPRSTSIFPGIATNIPYDPEVDGAINQPVRDLLADLEANGVECVDLTEVFLAHRFVEFDGETFPIYRRNNTHWSGAGTSLAAETIARRLGQPGDVHAGFETAPEVVESPYSMPVFDGRAPRSRPAERELIFRVESRNEPVLDPVKRDAEIHLLGDSFVNYGDQGPGSYGIHAHLVARLDRPVNVFASASGGPLISRNQFVREADLSRTKVVIWVVAESFLPVPDIWFDVPVGDRSVTNLEFHLDRAQQKTAAEFSPMIGSGSGIRMGPNGDVNWRPVKIGPPASYPKFSTIVELKPGPGAKPQPAKAVFSVLVDDEVVAEKTLTAAGREKVQSPRWTVGLKRFADREIELTLRVVIQSESPGDWRARWTIPQLKNAGFPGEFEPKMDPVKEKDRQTEARDLPGDKRLPWWILVGLAGTVGLGGILFFRWRREQS